MAKYQGELALFWVTLLAAFGWFRVQICDSRIAASRFLAIRFWRGSGVVFAVFAWRDTQPESHSMATRFGGGWCIFRQYFLVDTSHYTQPAFWRRRVFDEFIAVDCAFVVVVAVWQSPDSDVLALAGIGDFGRVRIECR